MAESLARWPPLWWWRCLWDLQVPGMKQRSTSWSNSIHDDVIKWKHFPRNWPFVRGIHRSPVNSTHKGQWRGALMFSLICSPINGWVNNGEAGDLRRYRFHCDVIVMMIGVYPATSTRTPRYIIVSSPYKSLSYSVCALTIQSVC